MKKFIFSDLQAGSYKMNFFVGFWLQIAGHLFTRKSFIGCFRYYVKQCTIAICNNRHIL